MKATRLEEREVLWCESSDYLSALSDMIDAEQRRLASAALGVCEECESGWIDQNEPHEVAPCPYCQPEKYRAGRRPWDAQVLFRSAAVPVSRVVGGDPAEEETKE